MKGVEEKQKLLGGRRCHNHEDVIELNPNPDALGSETKREEAASFQNHFVLRKVVQQRDDDWIKVAESSDGREDVSDGRETSKCCAKSESTDADLFHSRPSVFMSQRIDFYSSGLKSTHSEVEPNITSALQVSDFVILQEDSDPTYAVDKIPSKERFQSERRYSCNEADFPQDNKSQSINQCHSASSLHSTSSKGKYTSSGKPNVYRSSQANVTIPSLSQTTVHRGNDNENSTVKSTSTSPTSSTCCHVSKSESPAVFAYQERPATAPEYGLRNVLKPVLVSIPLEAERPSTAIETKPSPNRSTRSFLPFPIEKSCGKTGLASNRFLASNTKPLQPNNLKENAKENPRRHAPLLDDFQDNRSLTRGLICDAKSPNKNVENFASSPMDIRFPKIVTYVKKPQSLTESNRQNLSSCEAVMRVCGQRCPIPMDLIFSRLSQLVKVGEGVFGEVYSGFFEDSGSVRVYKIVAIEGDELVNGERQKTYAEILPEIIISQQVSKLHDGYKKCFTDGYIKLHNARITCGTYPPDLVAAWKSWDALNNSDNDCPNFNPNQLYIVFEYDHGGDDVECYRFEDARQTFYLALQVAHILAVGECSMEMEHRDLHWGNILVEKTKYEKVTYHLNGHSQTIPSFGVKACIIDFTIARLVDEENKPIFLDLQDDEEQFLGTGDHQFDIYRMMRDLNRNEWSGYFPRTNIFWVHYFAEKLYKKGRYTKDTSYIHQFFMKELRQLKDTIMDFDSCTDFILSPVCERFKNLNPTSINNRSRFSKNE